MLRDAIEKPPPVPDDSCSIMLARLKELNETRQAYEKIEECPISGELPDSVPSLQAMVANLIRQRSVLTTEVDELGEALEERMKERMVLEDKNKAE